MKLTDWAKQNGLSYVTAWRLFRDGKLPVRATQLETGTILVHPEPPSKGGVALYARVSGSDQRADLERQLVLSIWQASDGLEATARHAIYGGQWRRLDRELLGLLQDRARV